MARNQEKAQSMLYRFREAMRIESGQKRHPKDRTPLLPATTNSISIAEAARKDALKEVNRLIARVQDQDAELALIRTVNEEINTRIAHVRAWDERIRELGGLNPRSQRRLDELEEALLAQEGASDADDDDALLSINGVYYFGRARELPEALEFVQGRALLQRETQDALLAVAKLKALQAQVDPDTYYRDPDSVEDVLRAEEAAFVDSLRKGDSSVQNLADFDWITGTPSRRPPAAALPALPPIPTQAQVEAFLVESRKQQLLSKYT